MPFFPALGPLTTLYLEWTVRSFYCGFLDFVLHCNLFKLILITLLCPYVQTFVSFWAISYIITPNFAWMCHDFWELILNTFAPLHSCSLQQWIITMTHSNPWTHTKSRKTIKDKLPPPSRRYLRVLHQHQVKNHTHSFSVCGVSWVTSACCQLFLLCITLYPVGLHSWQTTCCFIL